jgi:hypothetical protein
VNRFFTDDVFERQHGRLGTGVLLVDDSWTSGANVLSAAAAFRRGGAAAVNAMVMGRLINPGGWEPSRRFIDQGGLRASFGDGRRDGFDPARSPWAKVGSEEQ